MLMKIETDIPKTVETKGSIKVWSERLQKYYYKSKNPNYYNEYFQKTKGPRTCEYCGKIVNCQLYSHKKSQKCQTKQQELTIETLQFSRPTPPPVPAIGTIRWRR